jgi:hypothetical protein
MVHQVATEQWQTDAYANLTEQDCKANAVAWGVVATYYAGRGVVRTPWPKCLRQQKEKEARAKQKMWTKRAHELHAAHSRTTH